MPSTPMASGARRSSCCPIRMTSIGDLQRAVAGDRCHCDGRCWSSCLSTRNMPSISTGSAPTSPRCARRGRDDPGLAGLRRDSGALDGAAAEARRRGAGDHGAGAGHRWRDAGGDHLAAVGHPPRQLRKAADEPPGGSGAATRNGLRPSRAVVRRPRIVLPPCCSSGTRCRILFHVKRRSALDAPHRRLPAIDLPLISGPPILRFSISAAAAACRPYRWPSRSRGRATPTFTLVEPIGKKAAFLRTVTRELALPADRPRRPRPSRLIHVKHIRRDHLARAGAALRRFARLIGPFFGPQTVAMLHKGKEHTVWNLRESRLAFGTSTW